MAGDLFSFLTPEVTDVLRRLITAAQNENTEWLRQEYSRIGAELGVRGITGGSPEEALRCNARQQAREYLQEDVLYAIDSVLQTFGYTLLTIPSEWFVEVDDYIRAQYPNVSCY